MSKHDFQRRAEWVWRPRQLAGPAFVTSGQLPETEANRFVYFRRVVEIAEAVVAAECWASADGRYQLFVNGARVGRGPGRCSSLSQSLDEYDLAGFLHPGRNVIAALAHSYGRHTAWYELPGWAHGRAFGCGGFFLQGTLVTAAASTPLDTGPAWRCLEATAWRRDTPGNSLGWMEHYDARAAPSGWNEADYDDHGWQVAQTLRLPGRNFAGDVVPFPHMAPRRIPPMREALSPAARIIATHEVAESPQADLAAQIAAEHPQPLAHCTVESDPPAIRTRDGRAVVLVCDFGEILSGHVHLQLDGPAGAIVDIVHGEQLLDDGRVRIFGGIEGLDAVPAHRYILREGVQSWERFEWSGLRYLQLTVRNCSRRLRVERMALREPGYPVEPAGAFECSDPELDRIWQAGATTLRRCMHDGYLDCPSREQRQWVDGYLSARINYAAFGDTRLAAEMLRQIEQTQQPDGLTMMAAPGDFARSGWFNIPDFCLYWIMMVDDYVLYTGDRAMAGEMFPAVVRALRWFERHLDHDGLLADLPHWVFVDWAELDKHGAVTAVNAQFAGALRAAARLADFCSHTEAAARYVSMAEHLCAAVNRLLWDPGRGVYVDARQAGKRSRRISQQANAAAIAYGVAPQERWPRILTAILDDERLLLTRRSERETAERVFDEARHVVLAQPFFMHVLHRALRVAGQHRRILDNIRKRWTGLLAGGEATLRETWQLTATTSLCHAWSGVPTFDLSTDVLGVSPQTPGFDEVRIAPVTAGLDWARGRYPTPHGPIVVDWRHAEGLFRMTVELPRGCKASCIAPSPCRWQSVDGAAATGSVLTLESGRHGLVAS